MCIKGYSLCSEAGGQTGAMQPEARSQKYLLPRLNVLQIQKLL